MSSLPPYNPPRSQRIAWLLHHDGAADAIRDVGATMGGLEVAWVERAEDRGALGPRTDALRWEVVAPDGVDGVAKAIRRTRASTLVVAGDEVLDALLRTLIELPAGRARLRFIPGLATTVQVLPDRAVLRHLNQGGALIP